MGDFSRDTFDKMKHYVGVRLQQGVPLVDADWNEMEDIRKFELQSFIKWFVGNGVPEGNDGFRIVSIVDKIIFTSNKKDVGTSFVEVDLDKSTAPDVLGFGPNNYRASRAAPPAAQLIGEVAGPFALDDGMELVVSAGELSEEGDLPSEDTVIFRNGDFTDIGAATANEVVNAINRAMKNLTASTGTDNDFDIKGGDGTAEGAGRCLVEGWDVINESSLRYTSQPLFENGALDSLSLPNSGERTDTVYLDVWEREVDADEDDNLFIPNTRVKTCVRLKREWVVRVAEGATELPTPGEGHVFYPLATLHRKKEVAVINQEDITDLRLTGLSVILQNDVQQIITDAYGASYNLDHDGQPNLKVSLREAINAILRGELPGTPEMPLTTDAAPNRYPFAIEDSHGDIWVFWQSHVTGSYYNIWYNRYHRDRDSWEDGTQLTTTDTARDENQFAIEDSRGDIWVFWQSLRDTNGNWDIWYNRYHRDRDSWEDDTQLTTTDTARDSEPFAIKDINGVIWVFWCSNRTGHYDNIWYNRYHRDRDSWEDGTQLTKRDTANVFSPFAIEDSHGDIWVFWCSDSGRKGHDLNIWYNRYHRDRNNWEDDTELTTDRGSPNLEPFAIEDSHEDIWVFWYSHRAGNYDIWYNRYHRDRNDWEEGDTQLTTDTTCEEHPFAIEDSNGVIWVFWHSNRAGNYDIWYNRYHRDRDSWEGDTQLTTDATNEHLFAIEDSHGDIWVFWESRSYRGAERDIWFRKLIFVI